MEKTMEQFVMEYAQNVLNSLRDHGYTVSSIDWYCDVCPLKDECRKHSEQNPDDNMTCGQFIKAMVTDGAEYK
jgi:adenine-specific DNA glycosylase